MGRPKRNLSEKDTVQRILDAAESEFGRVGFFAARLEDIARMVQIKRPSLLYHFRSKEELYIAVVKKAFAQLSLLLTEAIKEEGGTFLDRAERVADRYVLFLQTHPQLPKIFLRELIDGKGPGQELLLMEVVPVLDTVEAFIRAEGKSLVPEDLPLRQAILQISAGALVRAASGHLMEPLWGKTDETRALTRALLRGKDHGTASTS